MRIVVIGVGNPWRGDDGIGWAVADAVRSRLAGRAEVATTNGDPARLIDLWRDADLAIVVDAVHGGRPPGTILQVEAHDAAARWSATSSHGLGLQDAARLAATIDAAPGRLVLVGVEAASTALGEGLSPACAAALDLVAGWVVGLVERASSGPQDRDRPTVRTQDELVGDRVVDPRLTVEAEPVVPRPGRRQLEGQ